MNADEPPLKLLLGLHRTHDVSSIEHCLHAADEPLVLKKLLGHLTWRVVIKSLDMAR